MKKKPPQKARKATAKDAPPPHVWHVCDKVTKQGLQGIYEITRVSHDGTEADLCMVGTDNFQLFRVRTELLTQAK